MVLWSSSLFGGKSAKVFCITCSELAPRTEDMLGLGHGSIFEVRNLGGLFTPDAKAAYAFAMARFKPDTIVFLHHLGCGCYSQLDLEPEPDVRKHIVEYGCLHAKFTVEGFLERHRLTLPKEYVLQLITEEGSRAQKTALVNHLMFNRKEQYNAVKDGRLKIVELMYPAGRGKTYIVPERLEGSQDMDRVEY